MSAADSKDVAARRRLAKAEERIETAIDAGEAADAERWSRIAEREQGRLAGPSPAVDLADEATENAALQSAFFAEIEAIATELDAEALRELADAGWDDPTAADG